MKKFIIFTCPVGSTVDINTAALCYSTLTFDMDYDLFLEAWRGEETQSSPKTNLQRKKFRSEGDILACAPHLPRTPKKKRSTANSQEVVRRIVDMFKIKK